MKCYPCLQEEGRPADPAESPADQGAEREADKGEGSPASLVRSPASLVPAGSTKEAAPPPQGEAVLSNVVSKLG